MNAAALRSPLASACAAAKRCWWPPRPRWWQRRWSGWSRCGRPWASLRSAEEQHRALDTQLQRMRGAAAASAGPAGAAQARPRRGAAPAGTLGAATAGHHGAHDGRRRPGDHHADRARRPMRWRSGSRKRGWTRAHCPARPACHRNAAGLWEGTLVLSLPRALKAARARDRGPPDRSFSPQRRLDLGFGGSAARAATGAAAVRAGPLAGQRRGAAVRRPDRAGRSDRGTIWNGSADLVLAGGAGSNDATALPTRLDWRLRPRWDGVAAELSPRAASQQPLAVRVKARWGGAHVASRRWAKPVAGGAAGRAGHALEHPAIRGRASGFRLRGFQ